jgi:hypothetical protein
MWWEGFQIKNFCFFLPTPYNKKEEVNMKRYLIATLLMLFSIGCYADYDSSFGGQHFDLQTDGLDIIDVVQQQVHNANMWEVNGSTAVLADATTASFLIDLTSGTITKELHVVFNASLGGQGSVALFEDCQYKSSTTVVTAYNMDRSSPVVCQGGIRFYATPNSIFVTGTKIFNALSPGGTSVQTRIGGSTRTQTEWILVPGKSYSIVITNSSGGNIAVSLNIEFYEVN